jgi:raffinose/stachyose/melibiose transport system permease protein
LSERTGTLRKYFISVGIATALLWISPVFLLVNSSLKSLREIYINVLALPQTLTLENYLQAFSRLDFFRSFTNSFVISVTSTGFLVLFSSMTAWVLERTKTRTSSFLYMMYAAALLIPFQCVMLPLIDFMSRLNLMNRPGIILMYIGFGSSISIILFHGFIKNIPLSLEDAATIDGCTMWQSYFHVVMPMLKSISVTVSIVNAMWIWNDFLLPQLVINKTGWQTIPLKTYLFFGEYAKRWDYGTAALIIGMIPILAFYFSSQRYIVKGVTDGAIK